MRIGKRILHGLARFCLTFFVITVMGGAATFCSVAAVGSATCGEFAIARDYLRPIKGMPALQSPPASGRMPFAPEGLKLTYEGDQLVVGGGWIGFGIRDEAIQQVRRLNWRIEAELSVVNGSGKVISSVGIKRRRIGSIEGNRIKPLLFHVPKEPVFYRVDFRVFRAGTKHLFGEYSSYARAMKPQIDLRVMIDTPSVKPGEMATARLVNFGNVAVESPSYDYGVGVEAFDGQGWIPVPDNPPRGRVPKRLQILPAGMEVSDCLRYLVPAGQAPGQFRFRSAGAQSTPLDAEFVVAAP